MAAYPVSLPMTSKAPLFEQALKRIDAPPLQPMYQAAIGFLVAPAFARVFGRGGDWRLLPFFLAVLAAVRIVPAVLRHVLPLPAEVKAHWFRQRALAKRYDSYQWRKLFWYGLGLTAYVSLFDRGGRAEQLLALVCLVAGGLGLLAWRRIGRGLPAAAAQAR
jgi:hypothetical protein